jgi:UDP-GlcNAc:undecaprenyl-phosphate/decaprenyl-phosphate GlcNAc-1-phosphate transferase
VSDTVRYGLVFVITLVTTLVVTPIAARVARRLDIQDRPAEHKFHQEATPYLGGLAVVTALLAGSALVTGWQAQVFAVSAGALAMFALGLVDDIRTVAPLTKVLVQAGAAVALWIAGVRGGLFGNLADLPFTIVWVVAVTNAMNLLDNMDGVLSGVAAVSAFAFFLIAAVNGDYFVGSLALAVTAATLGFLRYNFPPARIFLGDAGSLALGFLLAALGLKLDLVGPAGFARSVIPVLILGVPLFDTVLVVIARVRGRRPVLLGSTDHTSHRLASLGLPIGRVAIAAYAAQVALICIALWMIRASTSAVVVATGAVCLCAAIAMIVLLRIDPFRAAATSTIASTDA